MILEGIINALVAIINSALGLFPSIALPGWLADANGFISTIWGYGAGLGAWVPWPLVGTVAAAVAACIGAGFIIKVVRIVLSFVTAGGGSAA